MGGAGQCVRGQARGWWAGRCNVWAGLGQGVVGGASGGRGVLTWPARGGGPGPGPVSPAGASLRPGQAVAVVAAEADGGALQVPVALLVSVGRRGQPAAGHHWGGGGAQKTDLSSPPAITSLGGRVPAPGALPLARASPRHPHQAAGSAREAGAACVPLARRCPRSGSRWPPRRICRTCRPHTGRLPRSPGWGSRSFPRGRGAGKWGHAWAGP